MAVVQFSVEAIQIHVLVAVIRPQAYMVTFVTDKVDQLVLLKETLNGGILIFTKSDRLVSY